MSWREAVLRVENKLDFSRIPLEVQQKLQLEEQVYIACSGGADSVFLLLLVYHFRRRYGLDGKLAALHCNHGLRAEASDLDAEFVRTLCESLSIRFLDTKLSWPNSERVSEDKARRARLGFFCKASSASVQHPALIATGHHADDVLESMLMRLSRGAGLKGLSTPREISSAGGGLIFLRPLLDFSRDELRNLLTLWGINWREDESNFSDGNYRARLRNTVIPNWESAADRPVRPGVNRSRRLIFEDSEALEEWADELWKSTWNDSQQSLDRSRLMKLPTAIQRRLLLRLPEGERIAAPALEKVLDALQGGEIGKIEASTSRYFQFCERWVRLATARSESLPLEWSGFSLPVGSCAYLPGGEKVSAEVVSVDESTLKKLKSSGDVDKRVVLLCLPRNPLGCVTVRLRKPGDAFKPLGKSSPKKLKELFIERKIPREVRDRLPIFEIERSSIVWVPKLPPNADWSLGRESESALRLTYDR